MMELQYYLLLICGVVWVPVRTGSVHAHIRIDSIDSASAGASVSASAVQQMEPRTEAMSLYLSIDLYLLIYLSICIYAHVYV